MSRIYRQTSDGRKWEPALQGGFYVLGDPGMGKEKHHGKNKVLVRTEGEAIDLLRKGYSIRVKTKSSPSLVRMNIYVDSVKLT